MNSPCAESDRPKLTNGSHSPSFNQSESSDVAAELDDVECDNDRQSMPGKSLACFLSDNEQLLLDMSTEDSSTFVVSESNPQQLLDYRVMGVAAMQQSDDSGDAAISQTVDESGRKVPSIEDFCSKDTKTLNTNVLIAETAEELATDSEKFHKIENTAEHCATSAAESLDDEVATDDELHELLVAACDGSMSKPVKETNFVANCREKFVDSMKMMMHPVTAYALTSAADVDCFITTMKQFCGKPAGITTEPDDDDQNYDNINNIKRIKIDDQAEKNVRMQVKLKVNTEQNQTRSLPLADCTATNAVPADQLTAGSSSPVSVSAIGSQTIPSSAVSCTGDIITSHHVQRAEDAWRAYISRNRSVIVDTFQGQFKSTVSNLAFHFTCVTFIRSCRCYVEKFKIIMTLVSLRLLLRVPCHHR